jgi:hypothetical protein
MLVRAVEDPKPEAMMPIAVACPYCSLTQTVSEDLSGFEVGCRDCNRVVRVPLMLIGEPSGTDGKARLKSLVDWLSAEYVLDWYANGGTAILIRTGFVCLKIFSAIIILEVLSICIIGWSTEAAHDVATRHLAWFGAIFAAVYLGLYARFSSQWTYLAGLYNQIMATQSVGGIDRSIMALWKAGFIADACELHLAFKTIFATAIYCMLVEEREVRCNFVEDTHKWKGRVPEFIRRLEHALGVEPSKEGEAEALVAECEGKDEQAELGIEPRIRRTPPNRSASKRRGRRGRKG